MLGPPQATGRSLGLTVSPGRGGGWLHSSSNRSSSARTSASSRSVPAGTVCAVSRPRPQPDNRYESGCLGPWYSLGRHRCCRASGCTGALPVRPWPQRRTSRARSWEPSPPEAIHGRLLVVRLVFRGRKQHRGLGANPRSIPCDHAIDPPSIRPPPFVGRVRPAPACSGWQRPPPHRRSHPPRSATSPFAGWSGNGTDWRGCAEAAEAVGGCRGRPEPRHELATPASPGS